MSSEEEKQVTSEHAGPQDEAKTEGLPPAAPKTKTDIEKEQEAKLCSKYPGLVKGRGGASRGAHSIMQKRLSKGQKYFDSGDYNMAKASQNQKQRQAVSTKLLIGETTGDTIPTPESLPPRKHSLIQSKLASEAAS